jgi:antitoxin VapB
MICVMYIMIYSRGPTMAEIEKARVFMSGRSQAVRIPAAYRFATDEVYIRRDPQSGDLILSQAPGDWREIYAALDEAGIPDDFLRDRAQGRPPRREEI